MNIEEIEATISDLTDVEPKSIGSDSQASEAAAWVAVQKQTEASLGELMDEDIKAAFSKHRELTGQKKSILEPLTKIANRVRWGLANWIAAGHPVGNCSTRTTWKVIVVDEAQVPDEYAQRVIDEKKLAEWAKLTEGKEAIPGCTIEPVHTLYLREQ